MQYPGSITLLPARGRHLSLGSVISVAGYEKASPGHSPLPAFLIPLFIILDFVLSDESDQVRKVEISHNGWNHITILVLHQRMMQQGIE